jgi:HSP20 family protein
MSQSSQSSQSGQSDTRVPVRPEHRGTMAVAPLLQPFERLRREMNRLLGSFDDDLWRSPLRRPGFEMDPFAWPEMAMADTPAVDVSERDNAYEITVDLPGLDEKSIQIKLSDGGLLIRGEKTEDKEEKGKQYYIHERRTGVFQRYFQLPPGVDTDKIEATFKKGVLTVTLPKTPEAQKAVKQITVKTG